MDDEYKTAFVGNVAKMESADMSKATARALHDLLGTLLANPDDAFPRLNSHLTPENIAENIVFIRKSLRASYE